MDQPGWGEGSPQRGHPGVEARLEILLTRGLELTGFCYHRPGGSEKRIQSSRSWFSPAGLVSPLLLVPSDAPKILGVVTAYTWEGNPANISCEVEAHPGASVLWFRDGLQLPHANTSNVKIHSSPALSFLEVSCRVSASASVCTRLAASACCRKRL